MGNMNVSLTVRLVDQFSGFASRIASKVAGLGSGFAKLGGDAAAADKKIAGIQKTLQTMANASLAMQGLSRVAAGLRQKLGNVVTGTANFDDALQRIAQTSEISAGRQKELRGRILELAAAYGKLPADVAESTYGQSSAAGLSDKISEGLIETSLRVSRATSANLQDIGSMFISLVQNMKMATSQAQRFADILHQAGKEGKFELKSFAQYLPQVSALFKNAGIVGEEGTASMGAAAEVVRMTAGTDSEAATNLINLMQKLTSPTTVKNFKDFGVDIKQEIEDARKRGQNPLEAVVKATQKILGGDYSRDAVFSTDKYIDKLRSHDTVKMFKDFGINIDKKIQWGNKHGKSPQEVLRHWGEKLINSKEGKAQGLTWEKLFPDMPKNVAVSEIFPDQQAMLGILALAENWNKYLEIKKKALAADGVIERDFEKMSKTSKTSFDRLKASSESLGLTWGEVLAPAAAFAADMVAGLSNRLRKLMDNHPVIGAIGGGIAGVVVALGSAVASASNVIVGLAASVALLKGTATGAVIARVFGGIGRGFAFIARLPWGAIRGAVFGIRGLLAGASVIASALAGITAPMWAGIAAVAAAVIGLGVVIYRY